MRLNSYFIGKRGRVLRQLNAVAALLCGFSSARAETAIEAAIALYAAKDYPGAEAALENIVAANPQNPVACYYLGMALRHESDELALKKAASWLEKAVTLAPGNAAYVYDYGETCWLIADRERTVVYAIRGRDAIKKAIALNPDNLDAREGLMEFYARATWPFGSSARALAQADEIGRRDSARGLRAYLRLVQIFEKKADRRAAGDAGKAALKLEPSTRVTR